MRRSPRGIRLAVEVLEDRCLLSANIVDLGTEFVANAINNGGLVAGSANGHAALWRDGAVLDLGTLGGAASRANDLNDAGQVVGAADTPSGFAHAFRITPEDTDDDGQPDRWFRDNDANGINDLMLDLGTLGGPASEARGINNLGQVVGRADMSSAAGSYRAFLWDGVTGMQNLGTLGTSASEANAINDASQVTGTVYTFRLGIPNNPTFINGVRWDPVSGGSLLVGGINGAAKPTAINQAGQIVGNEGQIASSGSLFVTFYRTTNAALWQAGFRTDLSLIPPPVDLYGGFEFDVSINKHAQIVGLNYVWQDGVRTDITTLVDPSSGWSIASTSDINDAAQIIGRGTHSGVAASFLLSYTTPTNPPSLSIRDVSVSEGNSGTVNAVFTVSLSRAVEQTVTVDFATADSSAQVGNDYLTSTGTLTFAPGEIGKTITISVVGDTRDEWDESFLVNLSNATNSSLSDPQGVGTIIDNDPPPSLIIDDVTVVEGHSGIRYAVFTVTLSAAADKTVSVSFATANGTATTSNNDYVADSGTLTFAPGELTKTISVQIKGDKRKEVNETFFVNLSGAANANILDSQGLGTILNDD